MKIIQLINNKGEVFLDDEVEAAKAYDRAAIKYFGNDAYLNL